MIAIMTIIAFVMANQDQAVVIHACTGTQVVRKTIQVVQVRSKNYHFNRVSLLSKSDDIAADF